VSPAPTPEEPTLDRARLERAFAQLGSGNPETVKNGIASLSLMLGESITPPETRQVILQRLAAVVRDRAPAGPGDELYGYCLQDETKITYPTEVILALQAISGSRDRDINVVIDFSNVNFAYASIAGMDLRNVHFDGAILCRSLLSSNFEDATFYKADLRHTYMLSSTGFTQRQLLVADSLFKSTLPAELADSKPLRAMLRIAPGS
jgi:hypothetical protein